MIYSLSGKLSHVEETMFVVECGGVGYLCKCSATTLSCLPPVGSDVKVFTTMTYNQESGPDLYGFYDRAEPDMHSISLPWAHRSTCMAAGTSLCFSATVSATLPPASQ